MTDLNKPPPPKWGIDEFTRFLDQARGNQFATFVRKPIVRDLIKIDSCFQRVEKGWINPKPWFATAFMFRAHSAYRAVLGIAMAGQIFEVFPLLRSCLECAAYGLHIGKDKSRMEIWLRRHDNAQSHKQMRKEFAATRLRETISNQSQNLALLFNELYERTIDFGAHPNERALFSGMVKKNGADRVEFETVFLHGDGLQLEHALKTTGQVGLWALHVFQLIYPERFMLLGVKDSLEKIRKRF